MSCKQRAAHLLQDLERWVASGLTRSETAKNGPSDMNRVRAQLDVRARVASREQGEPESWCSLASPVERTVKAGL